jgi:hypothetical protein
MLRYRLYFLEHPSRRIRDYIEFEAASDTHAADQAEAHVGRYRIELWGNRRKVWISDPVTSDRATRHPLPS